MKIMLAIAMLMASTPVNAMSGICWMVDFYVKAYGEDAAYEYALHNGWSTGKINSACRCLDYRPAQCSPFRVAVPASRKK